MRNNNQDIRRIDDSRQVKDTNGKLIARQFYVIRRNQKGLQYGAWQPFQEVSQNKKALRSYYNRHPQLHYPNVLADNDDEEFDPSQAPKRTSKSKMQLQSSFSQSKPRGRPSKSSYKLNDTSQQKVKESKSKNHQGIKATSVQKKDGLGPQVRGLFANGNQIIYHIFFNGKHFYQNRKWVLQNCKGSLIDFYERCMKQKNQ